MICNSFPNRCDMSIIEFELDKRFFNCSDYKKRIVNNYYVIFYLARLSDKDFISDKIIKPLIITREKDNKNIYELVSCRDIIQSSNIEDIVFAMLHGNAIIEDRSNAIYEYYICNADISSGRSISEPDTDVTVHGPHAGFVESLDANITEIRKYLRTEHLKIENYVLGKDTKTNCALMYLDNVIRKDVLNNIRKKLLTINIRDGINSDTIKLSLSGKKTIFPIIGSFEKPDIVSAKLLGGRAAIVIDGNPFVLTLPYVFSESIQSPEDYTKSVYYASFSRFLRFIGIIIAVYLPALIVCAFYGNSKLIPYEMLFAINSSREGVSFGLFGELVFSLVIFEIIREVGQRMPRAVGDAVGIVASIILGDAAVKAGISSMVVIMVVALCAVSNFIVPIYKDITVLLRFMFLFFAYVFSFYGIFLLNMILMIYLTKNNSFGIPYLTSAAPINDGIKDFLISFPKIVSKRGDKGIAKNK